MAAVAVSLVRCCRSFLRNSFLSPPFLRFSCLLLAATTHFSPTGSRRRRYYCCKQTRRETSGLLWIQLGRSWIAAPKAFFDSSRLCSSPCHASCTSRVTSEITVRTVTTPRCQELSERSEFTYLRLKARAACVQLGCQRYDSNSKVQPII